MTGTQQLVFSPGGPIDSVRVFQPHILRAANGTYLMYYTGYGGFQNHLMVAMSSDGVSWTRVGEILFLNDGSGSPFVLRAAGIYHIWFESVVWGVGPFGYQDQIYHATSLNGLSWSTPALTITVGNATDWDGGSVGDPSVARDASGVYRMYYTMYAVNRSAAIGVATSGNLLNWTKRSGNPVLLPGPAGTWDDAAVSNPSVLAGSSWAMFFGGVSSGGGSEIGIATSLDGYSWVQNAAPFLRPGPAGAWDSMGVGGPSFFGAGTSPWVYFDGDDGTGTNKIGRVPAECILGSAPGAASWTVSGLGFQDGAMDRLNLAANLSLSLGPFRPATPTPAYSGTYESAVFDSVATGTVWLSLTWTGGAPANASVWIDVHVGNTSIPDTSWSPWANLTPPGASQPPGTITLDLPRDRFIQFGISMTSNGTSVPWVQSVNVSFGPDRAPVVTLSQPSVGAWTNVSSPLLVWTATDPEGDPVIATVVELSQTSDFSSIWMTSGVLPAGKDSWQVAGSLPEGHWYWRAQAEDAYAVWGPWSPGSFGVDVAPPALTVTAPITGSLLGSHSVDVSWIVQDALSGAGEVHVRVDGGTSQVVSAGLSGVHLTGLADGNHTISVTAFDMAGNSQTDSVAVTVDTTAPVLAITSPASGSTVDSNSLDVTWIAADSGSGIHSIQVFVDGGVTATLPVAATSYHLFGLADGAHTITVAIVDEAGNEQTASISVTVDTTAPELAIVSPASGALLHSSSLDLTWIALDSGSGIDSARISIDGGAAIAAPPGTSTMHLTGLPDGAHLITVTVVDKAGNVRSASLSVTVDTNILSFTGPYGALPATVLVGAAFAVVAATVFLVLRRRRKERPPAR